MLQINDLTYRIAGRTLLDRATLVLPAGTRAGLVGRNGAGKTTLFRLILGDIAAEGGTIALPRGSRVGEVAQEAPAGEASLMEVVLAADPERSALLAEAETATDPHRISDIHTRLADIGAHAAEGRAAAILAGLGFAAEAQRRPCSAFSGGWRMRVALAAALFAEPDLLLLDEPTNYLDLEGTLWLDAFLAKYRHTVLLISHDRDLLDRAEMIVHLDQGKLTAYRGGYSQFDRQRREKLLLQTKLARKQEEQRRHMQAFVDRFRAKATKARQAQSRLKALAKLEPIAAIVEEEVQEFHFVSPVRPLAPPILRMEDVTAGYAADRPVLRRLNLRIDNDDRIGLLGANGNGKSTFAKLVAGRLAPQNGTLTRAAKMTVAYFAQHQLDELSPEHSPYDHVRRLMQDDPEARVRARTGALGFPGAKMDTPAGNLSGGEKARLLLGLATFSGPDLLILDEPTNHLDIDSRSALVTALADYTGAVILITHDRYLIDAAADRLWLVADGTVKPFDGDIDDYRQMVLAPERANGTEAAEGPTRTSRSPGDDRRRAAERRAELAPLRRLIKDAETAMERHQREMADFDRRLADPALYATQPAEAARLAKARAEAAKALAGAEERWLAVSADYESAMTSGGD